MNEILARILASVTRDGPVSDVRVGTHWTIVAAELPGGPSAGLASTQSVHGAEPGAATVRDAGRLIGRSARELAGWVQSDRLTERSIGFAALNALIEVDEARCVELNAADLIVDRGAGRNIAIVGHFPFVDQVRAAARQCWVLELNPGPGDVPAAMAAEVLPQADVVALTGMTLVNDTFDGLLALCRPDAYALLLGATTPLSPHFFDTMLSAVSGTILTDIPAALLAVSQAAAFRQIPGRRLVTMLRPAGGA
ncbi:MAG: hypothetical protein BWY52_00140 [Chloroflexi bacterium ADurb.Bin325]|nr:MAG: hypothetical protein BWY52_00140 [Chloroflexi bacterium ADurb.Bin325]